MRAAEAEYRSLANADPRGPYDLHSLKAGPDGTRGYTVSEEAQRIFIPVGPLKNEDEAEFRWSYCHAGAIVIAREVSAQSFLSTKSDMIFTLSQFQVTDTLKSSPDVGVGQNIGVMRFGGDVTDGDERLRVRYYGQAPFKSGGSYILVLHRNAQNPSSFFFADNSPTIPVRNARIYPPDQPTDPPTPGSARWGPFASGELVTSIQKRIEEIAALEPCK
jgi:hypothetical protein